MQIHGGQWSSRLRRLGLVQVYYKAHPRQTIRGCVTMPGKKNITKFIPGAIAENVFKYLYESIEPYKGYQYFENGIIDGKKHTYNHIIFELHPPKNNHFELVEVSTIEPKKDDKHQIRHFDMPAIVLSVDVLQFPDKAFVTINHSLFFEQIINNLLSPFANIVNVNSANKPWEHMPGASEQELDFVKAWCIEDKPGRELKKDFFIGEGAVYNYILTLRKKYPEAGIPKGARERAKFRFDYFSTIDKN